MRTLFYVWLGRLFTWTVITYEFRGIVTREFPTKNQANRAFNESLQKQGVMHAFLIRGTVTDGGYRHDAETATHP